MDGSVLAVLAAYQNNLVTSKMRRHKWLNGSRLPRRENTTLDGKELTKLLKIVDQDKSHSFETDFG